MARKVITSKAGDKGYLVKIYYFTEMNYKKNTVLYSILERRGLLTQRQSKKNKSFVLLAMY